MATSDVSVVSTNNIQSVQQSKKSVTSSAKNESASLAVATKPKTDTVSISKQAQALLTNSKTYSPAEESTEPTYEKAYEKSQGRR